MTKRGVKRAFLALAVLGLNLLIVIVCPGVAAAADAQPTQASTPVRPIDKLGWLVGGVWIADASKLPGGLARIESRYDTAADGAVIRFTTRFLDLNNKVDNSYAGNLFFDPNAKSLAMWYIDSQNQITQGLMAVEGDRWTMSFRAPGDIVGMSQIIDYRCDVLRERTDAYKWTLSAQVGSAWKTVFELEYLRS